MRIFLGSQSPPALSPPTPLERAGAPSSAGRLFPSSSRGRRPRRPDPLLVGTRVHFPPWRVAWKCRVPGWVLGAEARLPPPGVALQGGVWGWRVCRGNTARSALYLGGQRPGSRMVGVKAGRTQLGCLLSRKASCAAGPGEGPLPAPLPSVITLAGL